MQAKGVPGGGQPADFGAHRLADPRRFASR
jgi:hypothetical protein